MKSILVLIVIMMLGAQIENQMMINKTLKTAIIQSGLSNTGEQRKVYITKYTSPIDKLDKLTSPFGYRELLNPFTGGWMSNYHKGTDMIGLWHCAIKPIDLNGEVIDVWPVPNWYYKGHDVFGAYVRIKHNDKWISGYGHLSAIYVKEGDLLIDGLFYRNGKLLPNKDILGRQGNTGLSTGEHLHLSIKKPDGKFVDPLRWIKL